MSWRCHARPATAVGGVMCWHLNTGGIKYAGRLCCEKCGCTKKASDDRKKAKAKEKAKEKAK